jgi:hypothetical protein
MSASPWLTEKPLPGKAPTYAEPGTAASKLSENNVAPDAPQGAATIAAVSHIHGFDPCMMPAPPGHFMNRADTA